MFALVDCNNFYASCERVFNPRLEKKPVVVLSNNDGCIIARSNEAKLLKIPMGAPFFKWESFCKKNNVAVFSSNYELYGDMSKRVMMIIKNYCPDVEVYSIDEAFLSLDPLSIQNKLIYAETLRSQIKMYTGIPVSIGMGTTKTLAKIANHIAKNANGVFCFDNENTKLLEQFPIDKIWGIGRQLTKRLKKLNIETAFDLQHANPKYIREHFSVQVEKTVSELQGVSCIPIESIQPRQQIISSRSFGSKLEALTDIEEAISHYAATAAHKLRAQKSLASGIGVFLQTSLFNVNDKQYENSLYFPIPIPTNDTAYIIRLAKKSLKKIYKPGYRYHKAGIMLCDLIAESTKQLDFFNSFNDKKYDLMKTIDSINQAYGRDTIFHCAEGINRLWQIKREKCSPRYTTRWTELLKVKVGSKRL